MLTKLKIWWQVLVIILSPLILLPLPLISRTVVSNKDTYFPRDSNQSIAIVLCRKQDVPILCCFLLFIMLLKQYLMQLLHYFHSLSFLWLVSCPVIQSV